MAKHTHTDILLSSAVTYIEFQQQKHWNLTLEPKEKLAKLWGSHTMITGIIYWQEIIEHDYGCCIRNGHKTNAYYTSSGEQEWITVKVETKKKYWTLTWGEDELEDSTTKMHESM